MILCRYSVRQFVLIRAPRKSSLSLTMTRIARFTHAWHNGYCRSIHEHKFFRMNAVVHPVVARIKGEEVSVLTLREQLINGNRIQVWIRTTSRCEPVVQDIRRILKSHFNVKVSCMFKNVTERKSTLSHFSGAIGPGVAGIHPRRSR